MRINNNITALNTYRQLGITGTQSSKSMEKLSSGMRINRAGDDAAGLAISEKMRGQIRGLTQASRNSQDAISMIQTAEGALQETQSILQRMRELAVQAANGTYQEEERKQIQDEINQLTSEINRIGKTTEFNQKKLLEGSMSIVEDALRNQVVGNSEVYSHAAISNLVADASKFEAGKYKVSVTKEEINTIADNQIADTVNLGSSAKVVTGEDVKVDLEEGSYKVSVTKTSDPVKLVSDTADAGSILNTAGGNTAVKVSANSTLVDSTVDITGTAGVDESEAKYQIEVTKNVEKHATGSNAAGLKIEDTDVAAFVDGTRFDISVTSAVDLSGLTTGVVVDDGDAEGEVLIKTASDGDGGFKYDANSAITNLTIAKNSAYDVSDNYSIKVEQLGDTKASFSGSALSSAGTVDLSNDDLTINVGGVDVSVTLTNVKGLASASTYTLDQTGIDNLVTELQKDINSVFNGTAHGGETFTVKRVGTAIQISSSNEVIGGKFAVSGTNDFLVSTGDSSTITNASDDVKLRFSLVNDDGTVAVSENTFTSNAGAQQVKLADITFNVDNAQVYASDATKTDASAGNFHNQSIALGSAVLKNQVSITKNVGKADEQTLTQLYVQSDAVAEKTFAFTGGSLTVDVTSTDLAPGQTSTIIVDVETTYDIEFGKNVDGGNDALESGEKRGEKITLTEAQLNNSNNITNIALGAAGDGLFVDFDASKLNAITDNTTAKLTFEIADSTDENYTATVVKADGSAIDGMETIVLNKADADGEIVNFGEGIQFTYQGDQLDDSGDVFFSVKLDSENYSASLDKLDSNGNVDKNLDAVDFHNGDQIEFADYGLTVDTASAVDNGHNATFEIETVGSVIDQSVSMQIGANSGQLFKVDINDMTASALGVSSTNVEAAITDEAGETIEGAAYTAINKVTSEGTGNEYAISIEDTTKATAAIEVIENALTAVSSERAKLGSFQNRLEHTIRNLDTSSENLQAAESRVRDVDMAKEMMEFTKNNILQQAAQAMLAQANQQPQGVLQLLR